MATKSQTSQGRKRSGKSLTLITGVLFVIGVSVITDIIGDNINIVLSGDGRLGVFVGGFFVGFVVGAVLAVASGVELHDYLSETRPWYIPDKYVLLLAALGALVVPFVVGGQLAAVIATQVGLPVILQGVIEPVVGGFLGAVVAVVVLRARN